MTSDAKPSGSLACVGLGMMLGAHLGPRARRHILDADVVFVAASDSLVEQWVREMRPDVRSLQAYYREGKSRRETYGQMVDAMVCEVRAGRQVCGAFYGHPGVFARVPHEAIARARADGFPATMEPAVSAEDCLYADLGIDPGTVGCQHYEASQLLFYRRQLDVSAYLVLWQVGVVGDRSYSRFSTGPAHRQLLVERLALDYPLDHDVVLYEAATLPVALPRMQRLALRDLPYADLHMHTTLVVPPARALVPDAALLARLAVIESDLAAAKRPASPTPESA